MANSTEETKKHMLNAIGAATVDELFEQIPDEHVTTRRFELPEPLVSEVELKRHMTGVLGKNEHCEDNLSFLGGGTWQHHVPAICDEIWTRSEFLTSVWGTGSSDLGRNQAWFEFASQLGELVGMEFVGLPVYSWGAAVGHSMRMATRMTGRGRVLVPALMDPQRLDVARTYAGFPEQEGHIEIAYVGYDPATGRLDLADLDSRLDDGVAAVYFENPAYLGVIEDRAAEIARMARAAGAETIVGVDPTSLGVIVPPSDYGADIAVGTTQPLGIHMNGGGGVGGFIATRDEERYAREYPTLQVSLTDTTHEGERAFGLALFQQSSYGSREDGKDWTGNSVYLWAIANAAYMSVLGPAGFEELGGAILRRSHYAASRLAGVPGVSLPWPTGFFKEFVVGFDGTGIPVAEINRRLRDHGIFGGRDLSSDFPDLGQSALYCVTEVHSRADIDRLTAALEEVTR
ncbi:MAG: aminomethyl-transferring glycine dehydrogenase subunit GcvPA [bacterium]|nr:aminomethyl-transferring glycine dehydrogenase subunit GcvPA [bacterium]MDE0352332.1 aminomethyl-transferring glycine dehydrogenase subunit GcvPA [bacterium]